MSKVDLGVAEGAMPQSEERDLLQLSDRDVLNVVSSRRVSSGFLNRMQDHKLTRRVWIMMVVVAWSVV